MTQIEQYNFELTQLDKKIEALQNELRPLMNKRRQIKKNLFRDEWRKKKKSIK